MTNGAESPEIPGFFTEVGKISTFLAQLPQSLFGRYYKAFSSNQL